MTDHSELVSEMPSIERMSTQDRLKHARKRRTQQLKKWGQYEKNLDKEAKKKKSSSHQNSLPRQKKRKHGRVVFESSISLLESASRNDIEEVRSLLQNKTDPNVTNEDGLTALHQCCIDDNMQLLKLLLDYGANVNSKDSELWTPLHAAATCGHVNLCHELVDRGAELLSVNADGNMPYDICEDEVTLDYIETEMSKRGITQEQIDDTRVATERKMLKDLKTLGTDRKGLEKRLEGGVTPLHIAAANGYLEVADYLLSQRVAINMRDDDSWQPIHAAAYWGQPEMLELLVQNGADLDAKTRTGDIAFDLCEDPEMKQKILDMRDELETTRNNRLPSKKRVSSRSLTHSPGMLYSSNSSLTEKTPTSHREWSRGRSYQYTDAGDVRTSLRRSSLRGEKSVLFKKEAKEEALHFGLRTMEDDENELAEEDTKESLPATNIDDVTLILPSDGHVQEDSRDGPPKSSKSAPAPQPFNPPQAAPKEEVPRQPLQAQTVPKPRPDSQKQQKPRSASESQPVAEMRGGHPKTESRPVSLPVVDPGSASRAPPPQSAQPHTLIDLKTVRKERRVEPPPAPRQKTVDDHVMDMFLKNLESDPVMNSTSGPKSSDKTKTQNGHNNNNNRNSVTSSNRNNYPPSEDGKLKSFKTHAVIGGDDEKDMACCVIS